MNYSRGKEAFYDFLEMLPLALFSCDAGVIETLENNRKKIENEKRWSYGKRQ